MFGFLNLIDTLEKLKNTIIIPYRNRELSRVFNCLETIKENALVDEVIIVDYGSDKALDLGNESYSKVRIIRTETQGLFWNRAMALNIGWKEACDGRILILDIDLMFTPHALDFLFKHIDDQCYVHGEMIMLEEGEENDIFRLNPVELKKKVKQSKCGAIMGLTRNTLKELNGFDEKFFIWGMEDRDFYERMDSSGLKEIGIDAEKVRIYHQWHPTFGSFYDGVMPQYHLDSLSLYFYTKRNQPFWIRNPEKVIGEILDIFDRPIIKHKNEGSYTTVNIHSNGDYYSQYGRLAAHKKIINEINNKVAVRFDFEFRPSKKSYKQSKMKRIYRALTSNEEPNSRLIIRHLNEMVPVSPNEDVYWFLIHYVMNEDNGCDYYLERQDDELSFWVCRK